MQHPVIFHQRPVCGGCGHPMVFPRKVADEPRPAHRLAECNICAVAVHIPQALLEPTAQHACDTTVARPVFQRVGQGA